MTSLVGCGIIIKNFLKIEKKMKNKHKKILITILTITGILFSLSAYGESDEDTEKLIRAANQGYSSNATNRTFQELLYPVAKKNNTFSPNSSPVIYVSSDDIAAVDALSETQEDERGSFRRLYDWLKGSYNYVREKLEEVEDTTIGNSETTNRDYFMEPQVSWIWTDRYNPFLADKNEIKIMHYYTVPSRRSSNPFVFHATVGHEDVPFSLRGPVIIQHTDNFPWLKPKTLKGAGALIFFYPNVIEYEIRKYLQPQDIVKNQVDEITEGDYSIESYFNSREKIWNWIAKNIEPDSDKTQGWQKWFNSHHLPAETLASRKGVCRDYAHLEVYMQNYLYERTFDNPTLVPHPKE